MRMWTAWCVFLCFFGASKGSVNLVLKEDDKATLTCSQNDNQYGMYWFLQQDIFHLLLKTLVMLNISSHQGLHSMSCIPCVLLLYSQQIWFQSSTRTPLSWPALILSLLRIHLYVKGTILSMILHLFQSALPLNYQLFNLHHKLIA
uniref:Uncharacterized protein n=1 Tax=Melopsittacus undulatus TaxID=13146 RepID=A0A8V5FQP2_MELUD